MSLKKVLLSAVLSAVFVEAAIAANITYNFTTGPALTLPGNPDAIATALASALGGTMVSGSFAYDSSAPATGTTSGGQLGTRGTVYGGFALPAGGFHSSFNSLSASVVGSSPTPLGISDVRGFTVVGNDAFQNPCFIPGCTPPMTDFFSLTADPQLDSLPPHNISGFSLTVGPDLYRIYNVRMFWIEGQLIAPDTTPIGDFLSSNDLPVAPPGFHGRLALDFVLASNPPTATGTQHFVFYDGLTVTAAVPEPGTCGMLVAALGLLGFVARARRGRPQG